LNRSTPSGSRPARCSRGSWRTSPAATAESVSPRTQGRSRV
jgi:hypothetical protein